MLFDCLKINSEEKLKHFFSALVSPNLVKNVSQQSL